MPASGPGEGFLSEYYERNALRKNWDFIRYLVHSASDGACHYCGIELTKQNYATDHLIPRSHGGTNDLDNLVPACQSCNSKKGTRTIQEWKTSLTKRKAECEKFLVWLESTPFVDEEMRFYFERNDAS